MRFSQIYIAPLWPPDLLLPVSEEVGEGKGGDGEGSAVVLSWQTHLELEALTRGVTKKDKKFDK